MKADDWMHFKAKAQKPASLCHLMEKWRMRPLDHLNAGSSLDTISRCLSV